MSKILSYLLLALFAPIRAMEAPSHQNVQFNETLEVITSPAQKGPTLDISCLPLEIHTYIISSLHHPKDFQNLSQVNHYWHNLLREEFKRFNETSTNIIVIGPTGTGKSALCQLLLGEGLTINSKDKLDDEHLSSPFKIIHSVATSGTLKPTVGINLASNSRIFDCPGFHDTRGKAQDFINAQSILKLIKGKVRIIYLSNASLPTGNYQNAYKFLDDLLLLTEIFQDQAELETLLSVVFSYETVRRNYYAPFRISVNSQEGLTDAYERLHSDAAFVNKWTPRTWQLFKFLSEHPERFATFLPPNQSGTYKVHPQLQQVLDLSVWIENPKVIPQIERNERLKNWW